MTVALTAVLAGLPPTPEEVEAFVHDPAPDAYEKLVARLLASPHYGERWGRHWLDVVHFGETHGYDKDKPRPHAWPYRDWVVRSFNGDLPHGGPLFLMADVRHLKVLIAHGIANVAVPLTVARRNARLLYTAGMDVRMHTYATTHRMHPDMLRDANRWVMEQINAE